jgi:hypothetical protein
VTEPKPTPEYWRGLLAFASGPASEHLAPEVRRSLATTARVRLPRAYDSEGGPELAAEMIAALIELEAAGDNLAPGVAAARDGLRARLVSESVLLPEEPADE